MEKKVIDVSYSQGKIAWEKVKGNIDGVILRCGYGDDLANQDDAQWERNVSECERLGIPYGVYFYTYATTMAHAQSEISHIKRLIKGRKLSYPVYIDIEWTNGNGIAPKNFNANYIIPICEAIEKMGFWAGIYASLSYFRDTIKGSLDAYTKWVAQYNVTCDMDCDMWQYTSGGKVPGISGNVDMNKCYKDFPLIIGGTSGSSETETSASPSGSTVTLTGDYVNMRSDAYVGASVVDCLRKGTKVEWLADDGWGWSKIRYNGKEGWMVNEYLTGKTLSKYKGVDINGYNVNVRKGPGKNYGVIQQLNKGDYITCISIDQNNWMYAKINDYYAYVFYDKSYISIR